ncbi:(2,3-dihydroxybenzoyl)adenylate synthase [Microbacterium sp. NPDC055683]
MNAPTLDGVVPWPADAARRYREAGFWEDRALCSYVREAAARGPERIAVVSGDVRISYAELIDRTDAAAARLLAVGLRPSERVVVQLPNDWQFVVFTLACFRTGIIPVMALPAHRRHELTHLAELSGAVAVVVASSFRSFDHEALAWEVADKVESVRTVLATGDVGPRSIALDPLLEPAGHSEPAADLDAIAPSPDAPACFLLSGGTTGLPKLIVRTHNDYAYNIRATSAVVGLTGDDVFLGTLPASHNFPLACPGVLGALFQGGKAVMLPSPEPVKAFAAIEREGVSVAAAVPAVAQRWMEHARVAGIAELASLRVLQVGGSRMPDELAARVAPELGTTLQQVFGMAEGLINMTRIDDPEEAIVSTQGRPVSEGDEIRVVDSEGVDVADGVPGLILTRGPYTPCGYFRAPEHNARAFTEGWYGSGDVVVRRPDGNLVVHGREKDLINRGGEKISAEEVESIVYGIEHVDLVAAVSMPDPVLGERLCLYVTIEGSGDLTLEDVRAHMEDHGVAAFKLPDRLVLVPEMPLTKVGKIDKRALREDVAARLAMS